MHIIIEFYEDGILVWKIAKRIPFHMSVFDLNWRRGKIGEIIVMLNGFFVAD